MTDNEIIKSLEICVNGGKCKDCAINPHRGNYGYCTSLALREAFGLINRQKAKIEKLKEQLADARYLNTVAESDGIKEFAERLKDVYRKDGSLNPLFDNIDDLVKEMTESEKKDNA